MAFAGGRGQVAEPFELVAAELDAVGGGVLLDAGDATGAGDRGDVIALGEQPGQRDLRRCGAGLGGDGLDLVDDGQVALEVLAGEAGVGLAPVVVGDVVGGTDLAGEETVAKRGVGDEADAQPAQQRQQFGLGVAGPQRVLGLQRGDRVDGVGAADRAGASLNAGELRSAGGCHVIAGGVSLRLVIGVDRGW